jgi:hypothetical protein
MQTIGDPKILLAGWEKGIVDIVQSLRKELAKIDEGIVETIVRGGSSYQRKQLFAYIRPSEGGVNLGFHSGGGLTDPKKRLVVSGKNGRYFQISKLEEIDSYVTDMAKKAWSKDT